MKHCLTNIDTTTRKGNCSICGLVDILPQAKGYWQCSVKRNTYAKEYYKLNRDKIIAKNEAWRLKNLEQDKAARRKWRQNNKDKRASAKARYLYNLRKGSDDSYEVDYALLYKRDSYTCYICGLKAEAIDHLIPVSENGLHREDNLAAICRKCNSSKGCKLPDQLSERVRLLVLTKIEQLRY